jgi:tRNA(Ile2) C34 agmatinyltransferase TiaS
MPIYHGEMFTIKELSELLEKSGKTIKKMIDDAESKNLPLETYIKLYVDKQETTESVTGEVWIQHKSNCKKCKKSYNKQGRTNLYCPVCSSKMKYESHNIF